MKWTNKENKEYKKVLVTGAAGQIGYSIVLQLSRGDVFGHDSPIVLVLYDIAAMAQSLEAVAMELQDCALPLLQDVIVTTDEETAFREVDFAFLIGSMPRKEGMERKDLLAANVKIFKSQGMALANHANANCRVLVVGNPANTNAYVCAKYAAPKINPRNITAMTRLDQNRAQALIARHLNCPVDCVNRVAIWGNHSSTQYPDISHATIISPEGGANIPIQKYEKIDESYLHGEFIKTIQQRGAQILSKRKLSSAMSAAKAACDHMRDWNRCTIDEDRFISMAVCSDGSYGIPTGIFYSFPISIRNTIMADKTGKAYTSREWHIVQGLDIDDFGVKKMNETLRELMEEKKMADEACQ